MTALAATSRVHRLGAGATVTEAWLRPDLVELRVAGHLSRRDAYPLTDLLTACILEGARHVRVTAPAPVDSAVRAVLDRVLPRRT